MNYHQIIKNLTLCLFIICTLQACNDEDEDFLNIAIDAPNGEVGGGEGSFFLQIEASGSWNIQSQDNWCTFNKTEGTGNMALIGIVEVNPGEARSTIITITSGSLEQTVVLKQRAVGEAASFENAGRIEIPQLRGGSENLVFSHYTTLNKKNTITYSMEYDCTKKHSRWIAFTFYDETSKKNTGRSDAWGNDPNVPIQYRTQQGDFNGYGYQRGHLCASADRLYSRDANVQTFYYSNMSPQTGNFNTGIWQKIEERVQTWGKDGGFRDTLYVVKGGTIDGAENISGYAGNGLVVPKYYFMALLTLKNGTYHSIGFFLEHKSYSDYNITDYTLSIKDLEAKTGINFFHNLPKEIEESVENEYVPNNWPGL